MGNGQRGILEVGSRQRQPESQDLDGSEAVDRGHPFRQLSVGGVCGASVPLPGAEEDQQHTQAELEAAHPGGLLLVGGSTGRAADRQHDRAQRRKPQDPAESEQ